MRLGELGGLIQETMESYEVEVDGKILPGESSPRTTGATHIIDHLLQ